MHRNAKFVAKLYNFAPPLQWNKSGIITLGCSRATLGIRITPHLKLQNGIDLRREKEGPRPGIPSLVTAIFCIAAPPNQTISKWENSKELSWPTKFGSLHHLPKIELCCDHLWEILGFIGRKFRFEQIMDVSGSDHNNTISVLVPHELSVF